MRLLDWLRRRPGRATAQAIRLAVLERRSDAALDKADKALAKADKALAERERLAAAVRDTVKAVRR